MSTHRYIDAICVAVLLLTLLLTILFINGEAYGIQVIVDEDAEAYGHTVLFTENDKNGAWNTSQATQITLNGDHASVFGGGAYAYEGNVIITNKGKYVVSGTLINGSVIVDADGSAKVWIMLDGAVISNSEGSCLDVEQADKVFLSLAEGSENSMTTTGFSKENRDVGMDGTIFSRDDLTINGLGRLTVNAAEENGVVSNDELVLAGGSIDVTAAGDAIHANDGLRIMTTELSLRAQDDGISVTGLESEFYMESGSIALSASDKGIAAGNSVRILGGNLSIQSDHEGIASDNSVILSGGTVEIMAEEDGISANGDVILDGADIRIEAGDDGIHSDTAVMISGGSIEIPSCYEGIEAVTIDVTGGNITIYPEDDGMNANGGTDGFGGFNGGMHGGPGDRPDPGQHPMDGTTEPGERPPQGEAPAVPQGLELPDNAEHQRPVSTESADQSEKTGRMMPDDENFPKTETAGDASEGTGTWIHVSGGSITIVNETARDADGMDSNGDIIISGGSIRVSLVNSSSNSALDYGSESGGVMEISGGDVIACGSYAMAEGFDASSEQCSVLYNIKRGAASGTTVSLEDSQGNIILSYDAPCSFSSVVMSCPEMRQGETYTLVIGDSADEITLDTVSASFGDAQSEHFGGPMNWGGMQFRPGN